jgi:uncharacterized membrane protein YcaP (DUF421 family)
MKPEEIQINDWQRIFIGDVPGAFYLEVVLRVAIIYLILMVSMRLMGKRMASQLSRNEMIAMVSLAAAIGVPLQSPDRGILAAVVIAVIVVSIQQLVSFLGMKNQSLETVTQGDMTTLIEDSYLAQLRNKSIRHLGEVKRLYFEAGGSFTLIKRHDEIPGLPILPIWDKEYQQEISSTCNELVCEQCGKAQDAELAGHSCSHCGSNSFIHAVK